MNFLKDIIIKIFSKERLIGWVGAVIIAISALFLGMNNDAVKSAICSGPTLDIKPPQSPSSPEVPK